MSEEGELKKRIHKAYGELDDGICHEECLPNIDKIVAVMWSEFPIKTGENFCLNMADPSKWNELQDWFLRWKGK